MNSSMNRYLDILAEIPRPEKAIHCGIRRGGEVSLSWRVATADLSRSIIDSTVPDCQNRLRLFTFEIVQKLGRRCDTGNQQTVPSAGAGDIEQMPFGVIDLLQVSVVAH